MTNAARFAPGGIFLACHADVSCPRRPAVASWRSMKPDRDLLIDHAAAALIAVVCAVVTAALVITVGGRLLG
jgi:hypothetical protein